MAKLSEKVDSRVDPKQSLEEYVRCREKEILSALGRIKTQDLKYYRETTEETNMNTLREVTVTLIDNNPNLEDDTRIVFQKKKVKTSFSNEETKMNVIASGEVMEALEKHNKGVRSNTFDEKILHNTGRDVPLKPINLLSDTQLEWRIVETA